MSLRAVVVIPNFGLTHHVKRCLASFAEYLVEFAVTQRMPIRGKLMSAPTCNLSIRRTLFDAMDGFPANPTGQDLLFNLRLRSCGHRIFYSASAEVFHNFRTDQKEYLDSRVRIGAGLDIVTRQAGQEDIFAAGVNAEYRFLRVICRSPYGILLLPSKLFRLAAVLLRGDFSVLRYVSSCPLAFLRGLWVEGKACRVGYLQAQTEK